MTFFSTSSKTPDNESDANRPRDDQLATNATKQSSVLLESPPSAPIPMPRHANLAPPPPPSQMAGSPIDRARSPLREHLTESPDEPANALRISTDVLSTSPGVSSFPNYRDLMATNNRNLSPSRNPLNRTTSANSIQLARTPSLKAALTGAFASSNGSNSNVSSPVINAMGDVTPLPSPLMSSDSPGPWKRLSISPASPPQYRTKLEIVGENASPTSSYQESQLDPTSPKRKAYLSNPQQESIPVPPQSSPSANRKLHHTKNRSVSEYVPDSISVQKRPVVVSGTHDRRDVVDSSDSGLRRETHLAESRGLTPSVTKPPTPPPSDSSKDSMDCPVKMQDPSFEYFKARSRSDDKNRRWRSIGLLGRGTFSRVMLATSQIVPDGDGPEMTIGAAAVCRLDRKTLVAVKVCEHGPRGGASEDRVEMSLKRELEIMQAIHHPSLLDLKAWSIEPTRAILVMSYCPGGDLFDVTTSDRKSLTPSLMGRIVAELVSAVRYLHDQSIVHRDIKLENVLVNIPATELASKQIDWSTYPHSIIALADFGLSRRIAPDEQLETRCGSDDYAAPEVIMGQQYDGRATDAWSLGVLLYALLEARLPFDPHPGMSDAHRMRSRTSHRIARVEWRWVEYAGDDGDHDGDKAKFERDGFLGAMHIVEGLLRRARSRWTLDKVAAEPWVAGALRVDGGVRFREEDAGEEVS